MKIYTRTGDTGDTSLVGGVRVSKADPRVEAYGDVDELNAWVGLVRGTAPIPDLADIDDALALIQRELFALGAQLADPADRLAEKVTKAAVTPEQVARFERTVDALEAELRPLTAFILPGGSAAGAALHVARTVCRRAERRIVALEPAPEPILVQYVNRLSDLLFVMARAVNHRAGRPETEW
jgi:cob(I)alamin adenosyltransferase